MGVNIFGLNLKSQKPPMVFASHPKSHTDVFPPQVLSDLPPQGWSSQVRLHGHPRKVGCHFQVENVASWLNSFKTDLNPSTPH